MTATRRALIAGAAASLAARPVRAARPRRIVSLGSCLDVILVHVADRDQIAALSHYAREPQSSTIVEVAKTLPSIWETAEEVIALEPDLVLASKHSALPTRNALKRLAIPATLFPVADTVEESLDQVMQIAELAGHPGRGRRLIAEIHAALAAAAPPPGSRRLKALVFQPNGFAAGEGVLMDEMMRRAGFDNVAGRYGLRKWGNVRLEALLADPPEVLLVGEVSPGARSWADRIMSHPALADASRRMRQARLPERLLYCGGPVLIETARTLAAARLQVLRSLG